MKNYKILSELRKKNKLKEKDVADILHLDHSSISCYERGKAEPSIDILSKLAEIYGVSLDYLVNGKDNQILLKEEDIKLVFEFFNLLKRICMILNQDREDSIND